MSLRGTTVLKTLAVILMAVFALHQAIAALYSPVKTETAVYTTAADGINITGLIIRNETQIHSPGGVMHFIAGDGSRVAKNGVIANIYDSESASITLSRIDTVNKKISDIEEMLSYNDLEAADLDMINSKISQSLNSVIVSAAAGNYQNTPDRLEQLLSALNRRQAAMGESADFSSQLQSLKAELSSLSASLPAAKGAVTSDISGYFVSAADGYENVLKCDNLDAVTPEFLKTAAPQKVESDVIGKIVSDYEWYIAAEVSVNESLNFKEGDELTVYTQLKVYPKLAVKVKKINISESSSSAVLLFACSDMNSELAEMRSGPMKAVKREYSGLRVPKSALRVVDSKRGVYVKTGMQIKFTEVNVIYNDGSYMICEKQSGEGNVLKLYDEVVVKGKRLYDGKIVS